MGGSKGPSRAGGSRRNCCCFLEEGASVGFSSSAPARGSSGFSGLRSTWVNLPLTLADQVATQFKMSLLQLVEILKSKEPAYIRCIKPNDAKQPGRPSHPIDRWGLGLPCRD